MQINQLSDLVTYTLTDQEQLNGMVINHLQRAVMQNQRVEIISQLVSLTPQNMEVSGKETYWQQEAYLRGQLDILTHILERSTAVENTENNSQSA